MTDDNVEEKEAARSRFVVAQQIKCIDGEISACCALSTAITMVKDAVACIRCRHDDDLPHSRDGLLKLTSLDLYERVWYARWLERAS